MKVFNKRTRTYGDVIESRRGVWVVIVHGSLRREWRKADCYRV